MAKLQITIPHTLAQAETRRLLEKEQARIDALVAAKGGRGEGQWNGDRMEFALSILGQQASGVLSMEEPGKVELDARVPLPALLLEGKVRERLRKVLKVQ